MPYNLSSIAENTTGLLTFTQGVNQELTGGLLGILILLGITAISLIAFMQNTGDTQRSVAATAFIAFTLSLMLRAVSLIPDLALFITLIVCAAAIAFTTKRGGS